MQTTLLGLAIALILALLAALIGPLFIDWTQYRPAFEVQASRLLGLPVRVSGPIDVRLLPSPSLVLNRIEIGEDTAQQPLRAKALGIELALGSLIRGQVRATELRLVGPDAAIGLDKDGRLNGPGFAVGLNLNDISIAKLNVEDARLSFTDAASGKRFVFDKLWFGGEVRSLGAGIVRGEGAFVADGHLYGYRIASSRSDEAETKIKLSLEPSQVPLLAESDGLLSFQDGTPRFEGALTLTRPVGVVLADGKAAMGEPWRITSRITATPASALFEHMELQYGPEERALKATGTAELIFGETPHVEAVVSARQLDLDRAIALQDQPQRNPISAIRTMIAAAAALSRLPVPAQIGFGVDGVTLGGGALQSLRGDVILDAGGVSLKGVEFRAPGFTQVQISGRLTTVGGLSFSGPVDLSAVDPRAFVAWLEGKTETASGAASPLRGRGDIVVDDGGLAIERLAVEVDRKPVNGRVAYSYAAGDRKARLDVGLKASDADIDAMMALAGAVFKDTKIERPGEIALALDMERARFAGLDAQRAHVKASFDAGGLKIERLSIGDFGGMRIEGQGLVDMASAGPRGSMALNLQARDLSGLSALAEKFAPQSLPVLRDLSKRAGGADLRAALDIVPGEAGKGEARLDLDGRIGTIRLTTRGSATGTVADAAKADLRFSGELASGDAAALLRLAGIDSFVSVDNTPGKLTFSVNGPLNGDLGFDSRIAASNLDARAHGRLRLFAGTGASGDFDISVGKADAVLQQRPAVPVTLTARAVLAGPSLKLNEVSARVADVPLRGRLGLNFSTVTEIDGDVETEVIDAAALIAAASGLPADGEWLSEQPFTRGLYAPVDGRIRFRVKGARLGQTLALKGMTGVLRLAPSQFGLEVEDAEIDKGRLSGEFSARQTPDGTSAKMRIALKGADAVRLAAGHSRPPISGRFTLNAELEGVGRSPKALIGSLSGTGTLTLSDARIQGLDPKAFAAAVRAVDQGLPLDGIRVRDVVVPALDNGALSVRNAEAPFTISGGQIRFGTLLAQAESADVSISGVFDLAARTLETRVMLADTTLTSSAGRPEISMHLKGPAAAPTRSVDVAALTGWLALRAVEQQAKKLEAIESGNVPPVTSSVLPPAAAAPPLVLPEKSPVLPRTRPASEARPLPPSAAAPLPPPIDIKPTPGFAPARTKPAPQLPAPQPRGSSF